MTRTSQSTPSREGGTYHLSIVAGQTDDGERQVSNDRAEPADRESDMRGERELAGGGVSWSWRAECWLTNK